MSCKKLRAAILAASITAYYIAGVSGLRNTSSRNLGKSSKSSSSSSSSGDAGWHHGSHAWNGDQGGWYGGGHGGWHGGWHGGHESESYSTPGKSGKGSKSSSGKSSKSTSSKSSKSSSSKSSKGSSSKSSKSSNSDSSDDGGHWVWVEYSHHHGHNHNWSDDGWSGSEYSGKSGKSGSGKSGKSGSGGSGSSSADRSDDDWSDDGWSDDGQIKCNSHIPNQNEVEILINAMDYFASKHHPLVSQWTRAAFHDAGSYNKNIPEGGANGCLMNDKSMTEEEANSFFEAPISTLWILKDFWHSHPDTCMKVSSADILQFGIFFSVIRQSGKPGLTKSKVERLVKDFEWGRPDETNCNSAWAENLPENPTGHAYGGPIATRCLEAGKEIKEKLMDRNGFSAEEAVALIGAHTIGMTRHVFGDKYAGIWIGSGDDDATPKGPVFNNDFHAYFVDTVPAKDLHTFAADPQPFTHIFPNWYREDDEAENFLDTDMVLAFPSVDESAHPSYHSFTRKFAESNSYFMETFFSAMDKMSKLGVRAYLHKPRECTSKCNGGKLTLSQRQYLHKALNEALREAQEAITIVQENRYDDIKNLTTLVDRTTWYVPGWTADGWVGDAWEGDAWNGDSF